MDCPVCSRSNVEGPRCPQCDSDLTALWGIKNLDILFYRDALSLTSMGELEAARRLASAASALNTKDGRALTLLAELALRRGQLADARILLQEVQKITSDSQSAQTAIQQITAAHSRDRGLKLVGICALGAFVILLVYYAFSVTLKANRADRELAGAKQQIAVVADSLLHTTRPVSKREAISYRLRKGDSLWGLSNRFYAGILEANPSIRGKEGKLPVGMTIKVPIR